MRQRFQVRERHTWVPLLFIFGTVLYAVVEVMDRGVGALTFWSVVTAIELAVFYFVFRKNYVEIGDGHLTWVKWGHKVVKIGFSEIRHVRQEDSIVSILLSRNPFPNLRFVAPDSFWLTLTMVDPQGLSSSVEDVLRVHGRADSSSEVPGEPPMPPQMEFVSAVRWRRLLALALDAFVLVGLLCVVALARTAHLEEGEQPGASNSALIVVLAWVLYTWITNVFGMSLGKLMFGLVVMRSGTDQVPGLIRGSARASVALSGFGLALVASFFTVIPVFYAGLTLLAIQHVWSFVDRERRALYDVAAGTRVLQPALRLEEQQAKATAG